jgi:hypothetical protein
MNEYEERLPSPRIFSSEPILIQIDAAALMIQLQPGSIRHRFQEVSVIQPRR